LIALSAFSVIYEFARTPERRIRERHDRVVVEREDIEQLSRCGRQDRELLRKIAGAFHRTGERLAIPADPKSPRPSVSPIS
jgi:hypothetical protein